MTFVKDLKCGKDVEKMFAKYLIDYPWLVWIEFPQGRFSDYDILLKTDKKEITYEIKSDTMAQDTGNFVIEIMCNNIPSWIYASKADFIVYRIMDKWYIQKRWQLIYNLNKLENKRITKWWDWWRSEMYVISMDYILDLFEEIKDDKKDDK